MLQAIKLKCQVYHDIQFIFSYPKMGLERKKAVAFFFTFFFFPFFYSISKIKRQLPWMQLLVNIRMKPSCSNFKEAICKRVKANKRLTVCKPIIHDVAEVVNLWEDVIYSISYKTDFCEIRDFFQSNDIHQCLNLWNQYKFNHKICYTSLRLVNWYVSKKIYTKKEFKLSVSYGTE